MCNLGHGSRDKSVIYTFQSEKVNRVATENIYIPLEDLKHERLVLGDRRKKKAEVKWVEWPVIIMDKSLSFREH